MRLNCEVIIPSGSNEDLERRVLRFYVIMETIAVLDYDALEVRASKRHKWKRVRWWSRLDNRDSPMKEPDPISDSIIDQALTILRQKITYQPPQLR